MNNYFTIFNLESNFIIDNNDLDKKYFDLQKQYHPDKFINNPENVRLKNLQFAGEINEGYRILKDPLLRAEYILKINGRKNLQDEQTINNKALLSEIMELKEKLFDYDDADLLFDLQNQISIKISDNYIKLNEMFLENKINEAENIVISLKYLTKISDEIKIKLNRVSN